ncbi:MULTISPECIES: IucA/IucC family siderophore biosynthesis protein [Actinomycetes]|uniref:IucA/IucC family protein n=1 Tax=Actinomycetes TaxID=1760 RepID=UPI0001B55099|nr:MULTISPECIES: IucA/IucC family protein [Actinomycetes]
MSRLLSALVREGLLRTDRARERGLEPALRQATATGRLVLAGPVRLNGREVADPLRLLDFLVEERLCSGDRDVWERLRAELADSVAGHALSLAAAEVFAAELRDRDDSGNGNGTRPFSSLVAALRDSGEEGSLLIPFERMVAEGHPLHPVAKMKVGMSAEDTVRYSPEFGAQFGLPLVSVSRSAATGANGLDGSQALLSEAFPRTVAAATVEMRAAGLIPEQRVLIPVHPHQRFHALPVLHADALADGTVTPLRTRIPARPLISVRTLSARETAASTGLHVKTALEVQLTSAVRGVSPAAVHNGPRLSSLLERIVAGDLDLALSTPDGRPRFAVLRELASVAYVPPDPPNPPDPAAAQARRRSLAAVLREDSEDLLGPDELSMPIAALFAKSPLTGASLLHDLVAETASVTGVSLSEVARQWLTAHVERCVPPVLTLLVRYGIALEPHPQNTVLVLKNRWPHRVLLRDLGAARLLESRLARRAMSGEFLPGSPLLASDPAAFRAKLYYPLFGHHLGELVAEMANASGISEERLWPVAGECVRQTFHRLAMSACCPEEAEDARADAEALLTGPWQHKALLTMRLKNLVTDQQYVEAPNPLAAGDREPEPPDLNEAEREMLACLRERRPELVRPWLDELAGARLSTLNGACGALLRERRSLSAKRITETVLPGTGTPPVSPSVLALLGTGTGRLISVTLRSGRRLAAVCERESGFGANEVVSPVVVSDGVEVRAIGRPEHLVDAVASSGGEMDWTALRDDLVDSARNLALSRACVRHRTAAATTDERAVSDRVLDLDAACSEGHSIHLAPRVRRGFTPADSLAYCPESADTVGISFVAVRKDSVHSTPDPSGASVGTIVADHFPATAARAIDGLAARGHAPAEYELIPVHPWQLRSRLAAEYPEELATGTVVPLPEAQLACRPTVSVRTLVTAASGRHGRRLTVKTALDVQLTSRRRTISPATTDNGPRMSRLLQRLLADDPSTRGRVVCVPELAGIAFAPPPGSAPSRERGLSALLRADPADYAVPGETVLSACALRGAAPDGTVLAQLIRDRSHQSKAALAFFDRYAELMLAAGLPLLWRYGIGLEAHLQNTLLVVRDGLPVRVLVRDFGGIRVHQGRLREAGLEFVPHPGSITFSDDLDHVRRKVSYALLQANIAPVVTMFATTWGLPVEQLWATVRAAMTGLLADLPAHLLARASADVAFLRTSHLPQKAFGLMRLLDADHDIYLPQANPLHDAGGSVR